MTVSESAPPTSTYNKSLEVLPPEVLRRVFEIAVPDQHAACQLRLVSRNVGRWLDETIYRDVKLLTKRASLSFLWTLEHSRTKPPQFFHKTVRSLLCSSDVSAADVARILSICRNVASLTFWNRNPSITPTPIIPLHRAGHSRSRSSSPRGLPHDDGSDDGHTRVLEPVLFRQFLPTKLSLILHETMVYPFKPYFDLPFFHRVSHLSILNDWQEWAKWFSRSNRAHVASRSGQTCPRPYAHLHTPRKPGGPGHRIGTNALEDDRFAFLPSLTHIKLDFHVAEGAEVSDRQRSSEWKKKINAVSSAIGTLLVDCPVLQVCILVLRFDSLPFETATSIQRILESSDDLKPHIHKLVFSWERQPFRYMPADGEEDIAMWRGAEDVVKGRHGKNAPPCRSVLNDCDQLIALGEGKTRVENKNLSK